MPQQNNLKMKKILLILGNVFILFCFVSSDLLVPKCKLSDQECLLKSSAKMLPIFAAGIPEYKVLPTDPLYIESADANTPNLKLFVKNTTMRGVKDCQVERSELTHTKMIGQVLCDLSADGLYEMKGRLLVIPIEGKGNLYAKLSDKVRVYAEAEVAEYTGKDGKSHWKVKSFKHSYDLTKKAELSFSNLFSGSEELNKAVRDTISNNPNEVVMDIGAPAVEAVARAMFENINRFFKAWAIEDLILSE